MYILKRTSSNNSDFQNLVLELDKDLANKNGGQRSWDIKNVF